MTQIYGSPSDLTYAPKRHAAEINAMCAGFTERSLAHSAAPRLARNQRSLTQTIRNKHANVTLVFCRPCDGHRGNLEKGRRANRMGRTALAQGET